MNLILRAALAAVACVFACASASAAVDCSATITAGGTAQTLIPPGTSIRGFILGNIDANSGGGEPIWFSITGTAAAGATGSYPLAAPTATTYAGLTSFTFPSWWDFNTSLSVVAATTGHKISCTEW